MQRTWGRFPSLLGHEEQQGMSTELVDLRWSHYFRVGVQEPDANHRKGNVEHWGREFKLKAVLSMSRLVKTHCSHPRMAFLRPSFRQSTNTTMLPGVRERLPATARPASRQVFNKRAYSSLIDFWFFLSSSRVYRKTRAMDEDGIRSVDAKGGGRGNPHGPWRH